MREQDRFDAICAIVASSAFASVRDLATQIDVSPATIRRDIDKLNELGRLRKVYGGVSAPAETDNKLSARSFFENADIAVTAKNAVARAALGLVQDGERIIINGGSTCFAFGSLVASRPVNVYTNSMPLAALMGEHGTCALTVAGGELHREPRMLYDPREEQVAPFFASRLFTSVQGLSPEGLLESHPMIVRIIRQFASWADEMVLLTDSRKFDIKPRHVVMPLNRVHTVVTDSGLRDQDAAMLEREGIQLIIAPDGEG